MEADQKPVIEDFLSWLDQIHPEAGDRIIQAINYSNGCRYDELSEKWRLQSRQ